MSPPVSAPAESTARRPSRWRLLPTCPAKNANFLRMSCSSVAPRWRATWPRVQRCYETQLLRWASTDASNHKTQDLRNRKARHFIDKLIVEVQAGHGGDGCVSFHREKFVQKGPAAGGNGGNGGSVYIRCDPTVHSLARVHKRTAAKNGTHGEGDWLHGRRGEDHHPCSSWYHCAQPWSHTQRSRSRCGALPTSYTVHTWAPPRDRSVGGPRTSRIAVCGMASLSAL